MALFNNDGEALAYTQSLRKRLVEECLITDGKLPGHEEGQAMLLKVLGDMDKQTLVLKKIEVDAGNADADRQAALMVAQINRGVTSSPFFSAEYTRSAPQPELEIPIPEAVEESVMAIGISTERYEDFCDRAGD
jgi:hypothetical protein